MKKKNVYSHTKVLFKVYESLLQEGNYRLLRTMLIKFFIYLLSRDF